MKKILLASLALGLLALLAVGPALARSESPRGTLVGGAVGAGGGGALTDMGIPMTRDEQRRFMTGDWELVEPLQGVGLRLSFNERSARFQLEFYELAGGGVVGHGGGRVKYWSGDSERASELNFLYVGTGHFFDAFQALNLSQPGGPQRLVLNALMLESPCFSPLTSGGRTPQRLEFLRAGEAPRLPDMPVPGPGVQLGMGPESSIFYTLDNIAEYVEYINKGLAALYTGQTMQIQGDQCFEVMVGPWANNMFSPWARYAVNLRLGVVYRYDPARDTWTELGFG